VQDILANRIYYKFLTIRDSVIEIIEEELGDVTIMMLLDITVDEQPDFSYVTFTERLPQDVGDFNEDLVRYEKFVETYLNETNVDIDTGIGGLGGRMRVEIEPYDIVYDHLPPWGDGDKRQYSVTPLDAEHSLDKLNSYNVTVQFVEGWSIQPETAEWGPRKEGDLEVTIKTISDGGTPSYETTEYISRDRKSQFKIDTIDETGMHEGWVRVIISEDSPGLLLFEMHLSEAIVTTELKLTEIPGKTKVNFPDGQIKVIETKYIIEKNDTISL